MRPAVLAKDSEGSCIPCKWAQAPSSRGTGKLSGSTYRSFMFNFFRKLMCAVGVGCNKPVLSLAKGVAHCTGYFKLFIRSNAWWLPRRGSCTLGCCALRGFVGRVSVTRHEFKTTSGSALRTLTRPTDCIYIRHAARKPHPAAIYGHICGRLPSFLIVKQCMLKMTVPFGLRGRSLCGICRVRLRTRSLTFSKLLGRAQPTYLAGSNAMLTR